MVNVFISVVLPVFMMAGLGSIVGRFLGVSSRPISQVTLYIFSPALVCHSLANMVLPTKDLGLIALFSLLLATVLYVFAFVGFKISRMDKKGRSAFVLTTLFMNAGNYGLPVALFAFGQAGLERAIIFFVVQATLSGTVAIYVASSSNLKPLDAVQSVLRMPMVYATVLGLFMNIGGLHIPVYLSQPLELLGNAAVPSMLMVLGIQLSNRFSVEDLGALATVSVLRLAVSAGVAYVLTVGMGITGLTQQVLVVLAAMPTAVFTIILASEFDARPKFVTGAVAVTTLVSIFTITPLITLVDRFVG